MPHNLIAQLERARSLPGAFDVEANEPRSTQLH